jgi:hypothetical protein
MKLEGKAYQFNWLHLPSREPSSQLEPPENYGWITRAVIRKVATYIWKPIMGKINNCLRTSITDEVYALVTTRPECCVFEINHEILVECPRFLAAIIDHTYSYIKAKGSMGELIQFGRIHGSLG